MTADVLEVQQYVDAPPDIVFNFLSDPAEFVKWQGVAARFDVRPGGEFWLDVINGDIAAGEFVEIDPPSRLVFTWGWEVGQSSVPPGTTTVEIDLEPRGEGTVVRLRHHGLPPSDAIHAVGHRHYLARLAKVSAGVDPGPDPWVRTDSATQNT